MKPSSIIILAALILTACGTSPEPAYYSLAALRGSPAPEAAAVIKLQRPIMAGYLDRPDFVRQEDQYKLAIDDSKHWAQPMDEMFQQVLLADLQQRLPAATILTEANGTPDNTRFMIMLNVEQFNQIQDGQVAIKGELRIADRGSHEQPPPMPFQLTDEGGSTPQAVAGGLSKLIARVSDQIAAVVAQYVASSNKAPATPSTSTN